MEDKPPEGIVDGLPLGQGMGIDASVLGAASIACFDDGIEETEEGLVEGGFGEASDASAGLSGAWLDVLMNEVEAFTPLGREGRFNLWLNESRA